MSDTESGESPVVEPTLAAPPAVGDVDPQSGVRVVGEPLPYADGAEEQLLGIMLSATDRSTASDELAGRIVDWPTQYHLSRQRANLLRPLQFAPGARILDVGAGTGVATRFLAEQGAHVVALEGSLARARVAAARCEGLDNVEILCGGIADYDDADGFDAVLFIGVLEYSGAGMGGAGGPAASLGKAVSLLRPGGVLVVAIENQLGLKYLLGYAEDHLGAPWVGVEGYASSLGIRTWSRQALGALLGDAGLGAQRWLYPFPDYKLPVTALTDRAYDDPEAATFVDQWLRGPVRDYANPPALLADDRGAHRVFMEAGLGRDVANSFLVVAARDDQPLRATVPDDVVAWRWGEDRARLWAHTVVVRDQGAAGWAVERERRSSDEGLAERGWLRQREPATVPYRRGETLEQQVLAALAVADRQRAADVLGRWRSHLDTVETKAVDRLPHQSHPFLPSDAVALLPPTYLDIALDNFVATEEGDLAFIDDEWEVPEGVDRALVEVRALWGLANRLVGSGANHPWSTLVTADELCQSLGALCDLPIDDDLLERWRLAEAQLQHKVSGDGIDKVVELLQTLGRRSRQDPSLARRLSYTAVLRETERAQREVASLRDAADVSRREFDEQVEGLRLWYEGAAAEQRLQDELSGARRGVAPIPDHVFAELEQLRMTLARIQSRLPMRVYLGVKRRLGRI